jgi:hypothetical protein
MSRYWAAALDRVIPCAFAQTSISRESSRPIFAEIGQSRVGSVAAVGATFPSTLLACRDAIGDLPRVKGGLSCVLMAPATPSKLSNPAC